MPLEAKPYLRSIRIDWDAVEEGDVYPFDIPAIASIDAIDFHPEVTFLVGENGSGKSTLIEAIARVMGFGPEGGTRNAHFSTADTVSVLHRYLRPARSFARPRDYFFLRAESFYNLATYMDELGYLGGFGGKSLHHRSHGEAFWTTLTKKLEGRGLYIFDEPEAALSPYRQMAAISAIHKLAERGSQFIIATHSPILMAYPHAKILRLDEDGLEEVSYEDTEHFQVTRDFLANYERMMAILMEHRPAPMQGVE